MARSYTYSVSPQFDGIKLIVYLRGELQVSSRLLRRLKTDPLGILRNGEHIRTIDKIYSGDIITLNMPEETADIPESSCENLKVVYEDEDILVVDKPSGLAMHPTHNHQGDTLANEISAYFSEKGKNVVFRAVGRLDKCTSGIVIIALNAHTANLLSQNYEKTYLAIVKGEFHGKGSIEKNIYRPDPMKTYRWVSSDGEGEYALTHWEAIKTGKERSLMRVTLETGRTHQIRVHFASIGSPLAGDDMYGSTDKEIDRAALHCAEIKFIHPVTKEEMTFNAPMPEDMQKLLRNFCK